jgi:PTH1 family peptidyl-tRNA hydrolase
MLLIVGLGNPGSAYAGHRHNVGFMVVDAIARAYRFGAAKKKFQGVVSEGTIEGARGDKKALILKPATYMNLSGDAVQAAMQFYKLSLDDIVVFHDEIDLAPGKMRVKRGGGDAGNNGLRSITAALGPDYRRVRIGVGHPGHKDLVARYVLHDFSKADREWLDPLIDAMVEAMPSLADGDDAGFMNKVALILRPPEKKPMPDELKKDAKKAPEKNGGPRGNS